MITNKRKVWRVFPKWLKRPVKAALLNYQLRDAIRRIRNVDDGKVPGRELLSQLIVGWNNEGYQANLEYLEAVAKFSSITRGPILECGTGATTIVLGLLSEGNQIEVWSLEHSPEWKIRIGQVLAHNKIKAVRICCSPLVDYGEFIWYEPPLEHMPKEFSLVICDGPPGSTKGGRYGLLPVLGNRLPPGSTILVDDAGRPGETELIKRWQNEAAFDIQLMGSTEHQYAIMRRVR